MVLVVTVDVTGQRHGDAPAGECEGSRPCGSRRVMAVRASSHPRVNEGQRIRSYNLQKASEDVSRRFRGACSSTTLPSMRRGNLWASDSQTRSLYHVTRGGSVTRLPLPKTVRVCQTALRCTRPVAKSGSSRSTSPRSAAPRSEPLVRSRRRHSQRQLPRPVSSSSTDSRCVGRTAYMSDFGNGTIWKLSADGHLTRRAILAGSPADISYAPGLKRLLVPLIQGIHVATRSHSRAGCRCMLKA